MGQKSLFLGLFCSSFGVLTSVSWFVLERATSKGIHVYGIQARLVAGGLLIMSLWLFWQFWGEFIVKESCARLLIIASEIISGAICMYFFCAKIPCFDASFELTSVVAMIVMLTEYLLERRARKRGHPDKPSLRRIA